MALPLEKKIMQEIGLGMNYRYYNGSGSCRFLAKQAADKLPSAIKKHADAGEEIITPHFRLCKMASSFVGFEGSDYELTAAWQACATIIRAHMDAVHDGTAIKNVEKYLMAKSLQGRASRANLDRPFFSRTW